MVKIYTLVLCVFVVLLGTYGVYSQVPQLINYQGYITDSEGNPVNGDLSMEFKIYDVATAGTALWSETQSMVRVTEGYFTVLLGSDTPIPQSVFSGGDRYLSVTVGSDEEMTPRKRLVSVGYAFRAANTDSLKGFKASDCLKSVEGVAPDSGDIDLVAGNNVTIEPDVENHTITISASGGGGGDITAVTAGTGLNGGGSSGGVTLNIDVPLHLTSSTSKVIEGTCGGNTGFLGSSGYGVCGFSNSKIAVWGQRGTTYGFLGGSYGVYGSHSGGNWAMIATSSCAGAFHGNVEISGTVSKGGGSFKIDHPLDPANRYLQHSFVESPDMMNVYNGNIILDTNGEAIVELPDWFDALNRDFRYQLTCIGGFAQVYIAKEILDNSFKIAGGNPGMKVSWQVTGIRQDAFANAHRIQVEVEKEDKERGRYLHPEEHGVSETLGMDYEEIKKMEEQCRRIDEEMRDMKKEDR